jgi:hypothetical protein
MGRLAVMNPKRYKSVNSERGNYGIKPNPDKPEPKVLALFVVGYAEPPIRFHAAGRLAVSAPYYKCVIPFFTDIRKAPPASIIA